MGRYQQANWISKDACLSWRNVTPGLSTVYALSLGYGFLAVNPAVGRVTFAQNVA